MHINQATDYAFRAILYLARNEGGGAVEAQQIAETEMIPMRFLLKIMPSLIKGGIVGSRRGVGGGYFLARKPAEISFLDVIEAVEGKSALNRCLLDYAYCTKNGAPECPVHQALAVIQEKLEVELKSHNFGELIT